MLKKLEYDCTILFVTPYIDPKYLLQYSEYECDDVVYPALEEVPKKFAISKRNEWIVDNSDLLIFFIDHRWGGAYNAYKYALKRGVKLINFATLK